MQSLLMEKGIRITNDDPIFTLLVLNEVVLEDMTKRHQQTLNSVDAKSRFMGAVSMPANSTSMTSLQTVVIVGMSFAAGYGSQQFSSLALVTAGIIVGVLSIQVVLFFTKSQEVQQNQERPELEIPVKTKESWSEDEFQHAAIISKLSERTLAACREVLIDGFVVDDAAARQQIQSSQVFHGLKVLRKHHKH